MPADGAFDLDRFLALPRVDHLVCAPDGSQLVTAVATVSPDGTRFTTALWSLDPDGVEPPRRLTRSAPGEGDPHFLADGSLLFRSARPDPSAVPQTGDDEPPTGLWLLPAGGGEARLVAAAPAGIDALAVARDSGDVVVAVDTFPGSTTPEDDAERAKARKDAGVAALLFERYPIRSWDHYVGPRHRRLFTIAVPTADDGGPAELRPITPDADTELDGMSFDVTPDGRTVVTAWARTEDPRHPFVELVAVDTAAGTTRPLVSDPVADVDEPVCSPDGRLVAYVHGEHGTTTTTGRVTLWVADLATGETRCLTPGLDLWPGAPVWAPDSGALYFEADDRGHRLPFRASLDGGVSRLAPDGSYARLVASPDGSTLYALRGDVVSPPCAVALAVTAPDQAARRIPTPGLPLDVPVRVEEVMATADDGAGIQSWLVLPRLASPASPAPLVVLIHGGPIGAWTGWHWRWNPLPLVARGYAVLLPNPAISTGFGQDHIDRGRGEWGDRPYTDLMAAVDEAVARDDVDADRSAAMGGSFGGYMANWVAGHTDRFRCIVTHASLWALDQFHGTTDLASWWAREFGDPYEDPSRYEAHSPHRHVGAIRTPMLVIHGELDHRVPIGEALRLWTDLRVHGVESKFLYFPDENHWVLKPQNVRLWYGTVLAWLDHHVLGAEWARPPLL